MISDSEKKQIQAYLAHTGSAITLEVVCTADNRSDVLRQFGQAMASLDTDITFKETHSDEQQYPSFELAPNIHYVGIPSGNELPPFLKMLNAPSVPAPKLPGKLSVAVEAISLPAKMELYVMPLCPHCPKMVDRLFPMAWLNPNIELEIIDAQMFNQRAQTAAVKSVPTLQIDRLFHSTATIDPMEIVTYLQSRKPSSLGGSVLESMLKDGKAAQLADLMATEGVVFPAFLELLTHTKWPVRLGAMVALEELAGLNAGLTAAVIEQLWEGFDDFSDQIKGDILYLIGESGGPETRHLLASIDPDSCGPELCEAAADALQALDERFDDL